MFNYNSAGKLKLIPAFLLLFSLLVIFLSETYALAGSEHEEQISKGLDYCYHFKWTKAEETFQQLIDQYPQDPEGYHYLSGVYFWYYLSNKNVNDYEKFKKFSEDAINKAIEKLDKNETDASALYILGSNYNYRTVAFAKAENYVDAVWAAKKSESYLSECLDADSSFYDAYLGLGLYNFAMANIPSGFKWALNLAGISGNEKKGIRFIRITAEKGKHAKIEARYYLAQILSDALMDPDAASKYLEKLSEKYPENLLFNYTLAVTDIKKRELNPAEKRLKSITKNKNIKFSQIIALSNFLLGDVYFRNNNFKEAITHYNYFLNSSVGKDYTGIASYRMAICYEITGDRKNARNYFALAQKGNMDIDDDIYAERKGKIYYKRTLSVNEIDIVKASNLIEAGKYENAIDTLKILIKEIKADKLKAEVFLLISEALFYLNKFEESANNALTAAKMKVSDEKWVTPFAWFNAARASHKIGNNQEMKKYLEESKDFNGFDYQKKLTNLIENLGKNN